jgi:hypothetical protein
LALTWLLWTKQPRFAVCRDRGKGQGGGNCDKETLFATREGEEEARRDEEEGDLAFLGSSGYILVIPESLLGTEFLPNTAPQKFLGTLTTSTEEDLYEVWLPYESHWSVFVYDGEKPCSRTGEAVGGVVAVVMVDGIELGTATSTGVCFFFFSGMGGQWMG